MHRTDAPGRQCTGACQGLGAPDPFPSHKPSPPSRAALFHQILSPKPSPPSSKKKTLASLTHLRLLSSPPRLPHAPPPSQPRLPHAPPPLPARCRPSAALEVRNVGRFIPGKYSISHPAPVGSRCVCVKERPC